MARSRVRIYSKRYLCQSLSRSSISGGNCSNARVSSCGFAIVLPFRSTQYDSRNSIALPCQSDKRAHPFYQMLLGREMLPYHGCVLSPQPIPPPCRLLRPLASRGSKPTWPHSARSWRPRMRSVISSVARSPTCSPNRCNSGRNWLTPRPNWLPSSSNASRHARNWSISSANHLSLAAPPPPTPPPNHAVVHWAIQAPDAPDRLGLIGCRSL